MKKFYSCEQIAERYGLKKQTVWGWMRSGKIESLKIGKEYRICEDALKKFEDATRRSGVR